jgi:DNA processing protein
MSKTAETLAAAVAVTAKRGHGSAQAIRTLAGGGPGALDEHYAGLPAEDQHAAAQIAHDLEERGVQVLTIQDERYPARLRELPSPPPFLFMFGNLGLLRERGVGMCGSRSASMRGLEYARMFGREVAARGLHVISGYARGVDIETHLGALEAGGSTVIVLAEGIVHFRVRRDFGAVPFDLERVLVISQFSPSQPWNAGAAMTRNGLIAALSDAMLVIEAGAKGGTLNAGEQALSLYRPVYAIDYQDNPPEGNQVLLQKGAKPLRSPKALAAMLDGLPVGLVELSQLGLSI